MTRGNIGDPVKIGAKRNLLTINALVLLLFLGLVYAWSVFKRPLALQYGWSDTQLTWTFTICMSCFCLGGFVGARLSKILSPRVLIWICAVLICLGFVFASFVTQLWQLYCSYGVIVGGTIGIGYNVVISTISKWYPDRPGFISGLLLMAFGSGSLLFGPLATLLLDRQGWQFTMLLLGGLFLVVFLLTGINVCSPDPEKVSLPPPLVKQDGGKNYSPTQMLRKKNFWLYLIWCTLICAIGLALVGQVFTIAVNFAIPDIIAGYLVGMVSVCNGIGRILSGMLFDKSGRAVTMVTISACSIAGSLLLAGANQVGSVPVLIASFVAIALGYGAAVPTNANFIRSYFGNTHYATNFSIINFNILISVSIGQFVGSTLYEMTGQYTTIALAMLVLAVAALITSMVIKRPD